MKISFWISATVFYAVSVALCNSVQVGTVLFSTTDLVKKCWTECDKSLLKARLIMQDVLPDPDCIDFSNPEAIMILLEYFHACFQIISTSTYGKIQNLMYIALSDALGGYLRAYMLPFTRKAYYAGQVKYSEAKKLFQLYDDIKIFLKTNGVGWAKPQKLTYRKVYVTPLPITGGALEACHQLFTIEKPGKLHCFKADYCLKSGDDLTYDDITKNSKEIFREENSKVAPKNSKRFSNLNSTFEPKRNRRNLSKVRKSMEDSEKLSLINVMNNSRDGRKLFRNLMQTISRNDSQKLPQGTEIPDVRKSRCDCKCPNCKPNACPCRRIIVPLPILDDCESPHSIAVPFKKRPFRNLRSRSSAFVLEYYYIAVIKCFIAKGNTRADIKNFNSKFHSWLISQVYPHLSEEQWYPGFGGVLRVLETIKRFGLDNSVGDPLLTDIGYMFDSGVEFVAGDKRREKARNVDEFEEERTYSKRHVLTAIIIVSLIWIFVFCACAFYFQATRGRDLLYEGCSEANRRHRRDSGWNEKFINFQFLVQFFKKKDAPECKKRESESQIIDYSKENCLKLEKKSHSKGHSRRKKDSTCTKKKHAVLCADEDFSAVNNSELKKNLKPQKINAWPCQPCLVPFDKIEVLNFDHKSRGDTKEVQNQIQRHQIQTLWKKPSKKFKASTVLKEGVEKKSAKRRCKSNVVETTSEETLEETSSKSCTASMEDETKSIEKASSSCCCSENCCHTYSTTTNTTSNTQIERKLSSATMEFFEEVISRHKSLKKCSTTQESTEESDSEEESSSLSENNS